MRSSSGRRKSGGSIWPLEPSEPDEHAKKGMIQFTRSRNLQSSDVITASVWARPGLSYRSGNDDHHSSLHPPPGRGEALKQVYAKRAAAGDPHVLMAEQMRPHSPPTKPLYLLPLGEVVPQHGGVCFKGKAARNPYRRLQDALIKDIDDSTETLLVGVVDGHGEHGDRIALWVARELPLRLFLHPLWGDDPLRACRYTVADLASFLLDPERTAAAFMDTEFSGATLTFACVRAGVCYVSHLGEGRAVLGCGKPSAGLAAKGAGLGPGGTAPRVPKAPMGLRRFPFGGKCEAVALTCDHRPNQPEERERVLASGGRVFGVRYDDGSTGPDKCWVATMDLPGLSCSRALGDSIGTELAGVASEPSLRSITLEPTPSLHSSTLPLSSSRHEGGSGRGGVARGDALLILATDGLWDTIGDQEAVNVCAAVAVERASTNGQGADLTHGIPGNLATTMAQTLVNVAQDRQLAGPDGRSDDTTVVVVLFKNYASLLE